ncbi:UMP kinase [Bacillus paranthracis]|uniref:Uridylate kinase n=1 Tax=Bacillus paranthracis TaxID=2026186 RepID=A0AAJ1NE18_9BACI|nr:MULTISPECIES: UMP kinase [Bacillus cereus group]ADY21127.1 uridylate kinase [Bacillus thuringiensis serovar finitimus YBT-020]MRC69629.1 UMP kinase [Bacillus thuringiensis]OTX62885.1 UMP kinase [Bacillus thuringiensis serovar finitimus]MBG9909700.1 uridylate kinase [Bacillus paranthracis]MCR6798623.1 UMP kinase [Bacillus paranthracis]
MRPYKRVLIKLSGGALADQTGNSFNSKRLEHIANEILSIVDLGIEVSIVIGGGNIFRGHLAEEWGIDRVEADNIGTLGTIINSLMLRGVLTSKTNTEVRVMTSIPFNAVAEPYIRLRAVHHLDNGYIVIFGGGNGQPFVTTDYPSVQRAIEMNSDAILVAKQGVDGVFTSDPKHNKSAKMYRKLNYNDVVRQNIQVMDQAALLLARDYNLPAHVFNFDEPGVMKRICLGEHVGTLINDDASLLVHEK